jgi:hypothetical protein
MGLQLSGSVQLEGNLLVTGSANSVFENISVTNRITANEINVQFVSSSIIYSSGSNRFGDEAGDVHQFTGSVDVIGSGTFNGTGTNASIRINNTTATGKDWHLYSLNNGNFGLYNNTNELYAYLINPSGSIGVGITPEFTLDVNGDIALNRFNKLQFTGGVVGDRARSYLTGDGNNNIFVYGPSNNLITTFGFTGNVGVGPHSPTTRLDIGNGTLTLPTLRGRTYTLQNVASENPNFINGTGFNSIPVRVGDIIDLPFGQTRTVTNVTDTQLTVNSAWSISFADSNVEGRGGIIIQTNNATALNITAAGNLGINSPTTNNEKLVVRQTIDNTSSVGFYTTASLGTSYGPIILAGSNASDASLRVLDQSGTSNYFYVRGDGNTGIGTDTPTTLLNLKSSTTTELRLESIGGTYRSFIGFRTDGQKYDLGVNLNDTQDALSINYEGTEAMRITSGRSVLFQKQAANNTDTGVAWNWNDYLGIAHNSADSGDRVMLINRNASDGSLIEFRQGNVTEGDITVSGTTVSYNGGHLSRYSQTESNEIIEGLVKGTVMSNLDKMAEWINPETSEPYENEQLNCMKISDVEGDKNVAGVFVNWQYDSELLTNDMNIAMTGDMIIRIAEGVVVEKGDLLISAGDGTAKPQSDDLIRSNTIAKVISNHVTCVYEDGSYCVPCVLMAC